MTLRPISYSYVNHFYALRLAGNSKTVCPSIDLRECSNISSRCSRKYRATSAFVKLCTAACHSALAVLRLLAPRFSAANSRSASVVSEHSNRKSSDGRLGTRNLSVGLLTLGLLTRLSSNSFVVLGIATKELL
jgi:hypothetical protein